MGAKPIYMIMVIIISEVSALRGQRFSKSHRTAASKEEITKRLRNATGQSVLAASSLAFPIIKAMLAWAHCSFVFAVVFLFGYAESQVLVEAQMSMSGAECTTCRVEVFFFF